MLRVLFFVLSLSSIAAAQQLDYDIDIIDWEVYNSSYAYVKKDGSAIGFTDDDSHGDANTSTHNDSWGLPNADLYVPRDNGVAWAEVKECSSSAIADTIYWPGTGLHEGCSVYVQLLCKARVNNAGPTPVYESLARGRAWGMIEKHLDIVDPNRGSAQWVEAYLSVMLSASYTGYHIGSSSYQASTLNGESWVFASWELNTTENPPQWMWKVTRKRRLPNGSWENPTPPHHVVAWYPNNDGFVHWSTNALVIDNFYVGAYANMGGQQIEGIAKTPTGGSNPYPTYSQVDTYPKPAAYVYSVTKAF